MLILGGMGTVLGPVFGAFFLELLSTLIWANMLRGHQLVLGVLIVVVCLAAPAGLVEAAPQSGAWAARHQAGRRRRVAERPVLEARGVSV